MNMTVMFTSWISQKESLHREGSSTGYTRKGVQGDSAWREALRLRFLKRFTLTIPDPLLAGNQGRENIVH